MTPLVVHQPGDPNDKLAVLAEIERRLAAVKTVDEAKQIRDSAEALRVYAKGAQLGLEIQNHAAFVKIQAERKAGELLAKMPRADTSKNAAKEKTGRRPEPPFSVVLKAAGIAPTTARRWQIMAQVPDAVVRKYVAKLDAAGYEVTSSGVRRMWKELSNGSLRADSDGTVRWSPDKAYEWLIHRLDGFLQPGTPERRHLSSVGWDRERAEQLRAASVGLRLRVEDAIEQLDRVISGEIEPKQSARLDALGRELGLWA